MGSGIIITLVNERGDMDRVSLLCREKHSEDQNYLIVKMCLNLKELEDQKTKILRPNMVER